MSHAYTPGPLKAVQDAKYPFGFLIVNAAGVTIYSEVPRAYSSRDTCPEDVMSAKHFRPKERPAIKAALRQQWADVQLRAAAPDLAEAHRQIAGIVAAPRSGSSEDRLKAALDALDAARAIARAALNNAGVRP